MSINTLEKVLWDITVNPSIATDKDALQAYRLTEDERELIEKMDVREMADRGASQMLVWMAWVATHGFPMAPEYLRRMNAQSKSGV